MSGLIGNQQSKRVKYNPGGKEEGEVEEDRSVSTNSSLPSLIGIAEELVNNINRQPTESQPDSLGDLGEDSNNNNDNMMNNIEIVRQIIENEKNSTVANNYDAATADTGLTLDSITSWNDLKKSLDRVNVPIFLEVIGTIASAIMSASDSIKTNIINSINIGVRVEDYMTTANEKLGQNIVTLSNELKSGEEITALENRRGISKKIYEIINAIPEGDMNRGAKETIKNIMERLYYLNTTTNFNDLDQAQLSTFLAKLNIVVILIKDNIIDDVGIKMAMYDLERYVKTNLMIQNSGGSSKRKTKKHHKKSKRNHKSKKSKTNKKAKRSKRKH